eukprot:53876-Eustigmatos_ZCMA.PRE.1
MSSREHRSFRSYNDRMFHFVPSLHPRMSPTGHVMITAAQPFVKYFKYTYNRMPQVCAERRCRKRSDAICFAQQRCAAAPTSASLSSARTRIHTSSLHVSLTHRLSSSSCETH